MAMLAVTPGTLSDEKSLHRRFAEHRMHGEWFRPDAPILGYVASLK